MGLVARPRSRPRLGTADDAVLRAVWDEHAGPLLAFALRLTGGDRGRAEDIVQETLLRAWQNPQVLDPATGSPRSWLLTVARRIAVDQHRARVARPLEVAQDELRDAAPEDELDRALDGWLVSDALAALTPTHRQALQATYVEGRTAGEAATVLGVPEGTVRSRVFYALRALRVALQERGLEP